jgi:hypothetical protein
MGGYPKPVDQSHNSVGPPDDVAFQPLQLLGLVVCVRVIYALIAWMSHH